MPSERLKLKVCGMRDPDNIMQVATLRPDYMGFIFYRQSRRYVGDSFLIPERITNDIKRVGVFVNAPKSEISEKVKAYNLKAVQLHGDESPELCETLKKDGLEVIKVFPMDLQFDFNRVAAYRPHVHYFLFDTKTDQHGGSGRTFDWSLLKRYDQEIPFFLSGGISEKNVREVSRLMDMSLCAIDLNSGVETAPGLKDVEKIKGIQNLLSKL